MSNFLATNDRPQFEPSGDDEVLIELAADLPQVMSEFVGLLEEKGIAPCKELSSYRFSNEAIFYAYPKVVADYLDLYHTSAESVSVTLARDESTHNAFPDLTFEITCDDKCVIELSCPRGKDLNHPYTVTFLGTDIPAYACAPAEISRLISSMVLSPNQLSDIEDMRRSNYRIDDVSPRNPLLLSSFTSLLEDKSSDFSSSQTYQLTLPNEDDDSVAPTAIAIVTDQYANGASAYDISASMRYDDSDTFQQADIHAKIEVCSDGSLNGIDIGGKQSQSELEQKTRQYLNPNVVMPSIIALVQLASNRLKQAQL